MKILNDLQKNKNLLCCLPLFSRLNTKAFSQQGLFRPPTKRLFSASKEATFEEDPDLTVCLRKGPEYYDHKANPNVSLTGSTDDFELSSKIGAGKFSEVYYGHNILTGNKVAIKMLKEIKPEKIQREVYVLNALKDVEGVVHLEDVCVERGTGKYILATSFLDGTILSPIHNVLQERQTQKYIYQLVSILKDVNARGIFHRDIKPANIIIDKRTEKLTLIDWGLSDFYLPGSDYHLNPGTRPFKAPELFCGHKKYSYKIDSWSVGCLLAGLLRKKNPMFGALKNEETLALHAMVLGKNALQDFLKKYHLNLSEDYLKAIELVENT